MKFYLAIAALVVAAFAAFSLNLASQAASGTTASGSSSSSSCLPADPTETSESPEMTLCNGVAKVDVAVANGGSASLSSANVSSFSSNFAPPVFASGSNGAVNGSGTVIPVTGSGGALSTATPGSSGALTNPSGTLSSGGTLATPTATLGSGGSLATPTATLSSGSLGSGSIPVTGSSSTPSVNNNSNNSFNANPSGQAVTLNLMDASGNPTGVGQAEVCFQDGSGSGSVYQWFTTAMWTQWYKSPGSPARWVRLPTTHANGQDCAVTWVGGTFTFH